MLIRKSRLCQVLCTLMIVTAILPILFTYLSTSTAPNAALDPFPLYAPRELQFNNHLDQTSNEADSSRNLTNLMVARQNYLLSIVGGSLEEQVAFGFADLTNRLRYAESYASDRRQEIKQLMKEIRHLWELIQHNDTDKTVSNLNSNDFTAKDPKEPLSLTSDEYMHLPSVFSLLPFLHQTWKHNSISPAFRIAADSMRTVRFVFGIPTVKRKVESYLVGTLQNLIGNLSPTEQSQACFVVLIAETDIDFVRKTAEQITSQFQLEVNSGLIEIISPPASYYPDMSTLRETLGDTMERVKWRSKQNLDFAYLMMYCKSKGIYYVQIEDDIITKPSYLTQMQTFVTKQTGLSKDWMVLDFCSLGFIGKLFKSADLSQLILFFVMFYNDKPIDWLLDNFVQTKVCRFDMDNNSCKKQKQKIWISHKPSLFQHIGTHSSLRGKIQKLKDKGFGRVKLFVPHANPIAKSTYTSLKEYKNYRLNNAYNGRNYFWGFSPVKDDHITFQFDSPVHLKRCLIRSGNPEHPSDIIQNATLQVKSTHTGDKFIDLGPFADGIVSALIPSEMNPIGEVRIRFLESCSHWIIISEIYMMVQDVHTTTIDHSS